MEDKSYKDNIQKKFAQASTSAFPREGDDAFFESAWDNIAPQIDQKPESVFLIMGWVTLLLLMILAANIDRNNLIDNQKSVVLAETTSNSDNKAQETDLENAGVAETQGATKVIEENIKTTAEQPTVSQVKVKAVGAVEKPSILTADTRNIQASSSENKRNKNNSVVYITEEEAVVEEKSTSEIFKELRSFTPVMMLNSSIMPLATRGNSFDIMKMMGQLPILDEGMNNALDSETNPWAIGVYGQIGGGRFFGGNSTQEINGLNFQLDGGLSFEQGISLHHKKGRSVISGSVGYGQHELTSEYKLHVNYRSTGEFSDGMGFLHNAYEHDLQTIGGALGIKHVLFRDASDQLNEGEVVPFNLTLTQTIQFVPFSMEYAYQWPLFKGLKLESGVGVEGRYNWMDKVFDDISLRSEHQLIHHNYTKAQSVDAQNLQPWSMGINGRLSLQYEVNRIQWILGVRVQETILDPALHDKMEVHPTFVAGHLGIRYNL